ncbi:MAG: metal ABC transporter solute-binding protein, Zn/Mn family [Bacteroidota bacterium]
MKSVFAWWHAIKKHGCTILLVVCGVGCDDGTEDQFTVVTTTNLIGDAVKNIVQDHARVISLMGPGVDPHAYKATQQDVKNLRNADIVFYNGLHLEGKMTDILHKLSSRRPIYAVSDAISPEQRLVDADFAIGVDPHIWFDICLWKQVVQYISNKLQAAAPEAAVCYQENTKRYLQQLDTLHQETLQAIQHIPATQRVLITAHDAFGYFGRAYNMEVRGLQGISTVSEFGLKDVTDLVKFIIHRNIKAIFLETSVPEKPLQAVVEGCRQRGFQVKVGGYLYSDTLGQSNTPQGNYYGMFQTNVQTIVKALK